MDIVGYDQARLKNKWNGERINSVFQYTDFLKMSILNLHGTPIILTNGFIEVVNYDLNSVEIGERPLHRLTCLVPHFENGFDGFDGFDGFENVIFLLSS